MRKQLLLTLFALTSVVAVAQPVPELMWYKFDGSGTTVTNYASAPVAPTATIMGGVTQGGTTICDGGLIGTGVSSTTDYLNTGWAPNLGGTAWTIAWRSSGISTNATLYYIFGDVGTASFRCFTNGIAGSTNWVIRGAGMTDVYINGGALSTPTACAYVYDPVAGNIRAYLNGVLVSTVAQGAVNLTGTGPMKVMGYSSNVGAPAGGVLDDFRLYNRALSASEIAEIHNPFATPGFLGGDTVVCGGTPITLKLDPTHGVAGDWSTGATVVDSIIVTSAGTYSVDVSGTCGDGNDTIVVTDIPTLPAGFLGMDASFCTGDSLWTGISIPMDSILWSTGSISDSISIDTAGSYSVVASNSCGTYMDTLDVSEAFPLAAGFLGADIALCVGDTAMLTIGSPLDSLLWSTGDMVDPIWTSTLGTYTVEAWNACGSYNDTLDVVASALVYTGFIWPDSATYCEGDTVMIVADSTYDTYAWSTGDSTSTIWVTVGGTYTLTVTDACGSGTESANVTLGTAPVAGFTFSTTTGGTADFTDATSGTGPYTYAWDFGDGSGTSSLASPSYTYATDGTYLVTLIVSSACGSDTITDSVSIIIIGMSDALDKGMTLYPNPTRDEVTVEGNFASTSTVLVTVETLLGEQVIREEMLSSNGQFKSNLDLHTLPAGLYLVRFSSGGHTAVKRLVINR